MNDLKRKYTLKGTARFNLLYRGKVVDGIPQMPTVIIPPFDKVRDNDGTWKDIALIERQGPNDKNGNPTYFYRDIVFHPAMGCSMLLNENKKGDQEVYQYLMSSNFRKDNEMRDPNIEPLYELVDEKGKAEKEMTEIRLANDITNYALHAPIEHLIREVASPYGFYKVGEDEEVLRNKILKWGKDHPNEFMATRKPPDKSVSERVQKLVDNGEIAYNASKGAWFWGLESLMKMPRNAGKNKDEKLSLLAQWLKEEEQSEILQRVIEHTS